MNTKPSSNGKRKSVQLAGWLRLAQTQLVCAILKYPHRLVEEVLGPNSGSKVPMEKVMMIIWQFRDDPQVVKFMTRFVSKMAGSRHVFDGIEFYLPQLAHMIIHLEAEWDDAVLERFALVIAQQSLHFALQLNWILQGAIEDYQPELPDGSVNPDYHPLYYFRCIKLLKNVERCVVYRKPRSAELQALYEKGKISKQEMLQLEQADRRFQALQIAEMDREEEGKENFGGNLLYKRAIRTACYKPKPWKDRYFAIQENMLNCYSSQDGRLVRSMPLEGAEVRIIPPNESRYKNMFVVANRSFEFRMRAANQEDMKKWVKMLTDEAESRTVFGHMDASVHKANAEQDRLVSEMTPGQRERFTFFRNEREFVRRLTDIAEELRFKEPAERKIIAPTLMRHMEIKPCVYSPLCGSTEVWRRVHGVLYKDTRVFNTNERCPVIMYFLGARGEIESKRKGGIRDANLDVTEYMHLRFDNPDEEVLDAHKEQIDDEDELTLEDLKQEKASSAVWNDSVQPGDSNSGAGSPRNNFNESFSAIPRNLAKRLEGRNRRRSYLSNTTVLNHVPILEGQSNNNILPVAGGISVGRSSILSPQKGMITGEAHTGEITKEYIDKAKQIVSGGESWAEKSKRMLEEAKFKPEGAELEVVGLMSKSNDDLRQEVFIMQMIHYYKSVFAKANIPVWLKTYRILSTSSSTGLIEVLVDATSIDGLKKSEGFPYEEGGMRAYFERTYGGPKSKAFKAAQRNFMQSLAGYSIISYLLGLKDRHNGNIMIDTRGHLIHIDFGFVMGMAPGNDFSMERAPFKLTKEYVEVMGGLDSECFKEYENLVVQGFNEARKNSQIALGLVEIMMYKSKYPCFSGKFGNGVALKQFERRLMLHVPEGVVETHARNLLKQSYDHWGTNFYDKFQKWSNGYAI